MDVVGMPNTSFHTKSPQRMLMRSGKCPIEAYNSHVCVTCYSCTMAVRGLRGMLVIPFHECSGATSVPRKAQANAIVQVACMIRTSSKIFAL